MTYTPPTLTMYLQARARGTDAVAALWADAPGASLTAKPSDWTDAPPPSQRAPKRPPQGSLL